jgi:hypothetical protein
LLDGPQGTVRRAPNNAYTQAHDNMPEYAGSVRGVSKNILPMRGNIHSYHTPSQARSQNLGSSAMSEMIKIATKAEMEQHKQQMDAITAVITT